MDRTCEVAEDRVKWKKVCFASMGLRRRLKLINEQIYFFKCILVLQLLLKLIYIFKGT